MLHRLGPRLCPLIALVALGCDTSQPSLYIPPGPTPVYAPEPSLSRPSVFRLDAPDGLPMPPDDNGTIGLAANTTYVARVSLDYPPRDCLVRLVPSWAAAAGAQNCPAGSEPSARFSFEFTTPAEVSSQRLVVAAEKNGAPFAEASVGLRIIPASTFAAEPEFAVASLREGPIGSNGWFLEMDGGTLIVAPDSVYTATLWLKDARFGGCTVLVLTNWGPATVLQCPDGIQQGVNIEYQFTTPRQTPLAELEFFAQYAGETFASTGLYMRVR
jgi:hypothetical protein